MTYNLQSNVTYELPGIDWKITIPKEYEKFVIQLYGGAGSASLINGQVFNGGTGGNVIVSLKLQKNDELIVRIGYGGNSLTIENYKSKTVNGNAGKASYILLNGIMIATAYGAIGIKGGDGFVEKNDRILFAQIIKGTDGKLNIQDTHDWLSPYIDFNGERKCGGKCKRYENGIVYLGAGGPGVAHTTICTIEK